MMGCAFKFDVYSHFVKITDYDYTGKEALVDYACNELAEISLNWDPYNGGYKRKLERFYAMSTANRREFRFHRNSLESLLTFLKRRGFMETMFNIYEHPLYEPDKVDLKLLPGRTPKDYQVPQMKHLVSPGPTKIVELQTGKGKTFTALASAVQIGTRGVIEIRSQFVDRWLTDLVDPANMVLDIKKTDVMVVRGSKDLRLLIQLAKAKLLEAKIIIITNKTLQGFYTHYERTNGDTTFYGCSPEEIYELMGVGWRLIDEVHLDFHLNFKHDLYTHVPKTISLSATLVTTNRQTQKMYDLVFPPDARTDPGEYDKYIVAKALFYNIERADRVRYMRRGRNSYSHIDFEQSVMKDKKMLTNYMEMIRKIAQIEYVANREEGQRMLIFASAVEMCDVLAKYLQEAFPTLKVRKYTGGDDESNLMTSDICVSTLGASGTAVDIPGLKVVLSTTAVDSVQTVMQSMGRLRKLKQWPDVSPVYIYLVCEDIDKHISYHNRKVERLQGRVVSHKVEYTRARI